MSRFNSAEEFSKSESPNLKSTHFNHQVALQIAKIYHQVTILNSAISAEEQLIQNKNKNIASYSHA